MKAQELKKGRAVEMDGGVWLVMDIEFVKPGKGPAYAQVRFRNVSTGAYSDKRLRSGEDVEEAYVDRRQLEYLYPDADGAVFMDSETFDQAAVPAQVLGDAMQFIKPNTMVTGLVYNGTVLAVELPASVELQITDTTPQVKGATVTNQLKDATCETGLVTRVPPFIEVGEIVRISTETGEYQGRGGD